jgi:hypothetical protein
MGRVASVTNTVREYQKRLYFIRILTKVYMSNLTSFMHIKAVVSDNMLVGPCKDMARFHPFILKLIRNYSTTRDENSVVAVNWTGLHFERRDAQASVQRSMVEPECYEEHSSVQYCIHVFSSAHIHTRNTYITLFYLSKGNNKTTKHMYFETNPPPSTRFVSLFRKEIKLWKLGIGHKMWVSFFFYRFCP